jgi:hypothetical protein
MDEDTQYKKNESAKTKVNKPIICADGFRMSVQAHSLANCKKDPATGRYTHVEVGYPTEAEQLLEEWAEEPENLCKTIYPYVPAQRVALVCAKHGGIISGELPAGVVYLKPPKGGE